MIVIYVFCVIIIIILLFIEYFFCRKNKILNHYTYHMSESKPDNLTITNLYKSTPDPISYINKFYNSYLNNDIDEQPISVTILKKSEYNSDIETESDSDNNI
jgi:hypothetical protein